MFYIVIPSSKKFQPVLLEKIIRNPLNLENSL